MSQRATAISLQINEIFYFLECTPNSSFFANRKDNENNQDNENYPDNKNEGNYAANKYMFKEKKFWCLYGQF